MDPLRIQTAQNVDLSFATAGLGYRILAWIVDIVVIVAYLFAAFTLVGQLGFWRYGTLTLHVVIWLPVLLYHPLFEILLEGRTPGKMVFKVRVARLDGAQPSLGQYLLRWLLRFVDVTLSSGMVAVISIGATNKAQRLGDIAAGTTVVRMHRRVRLNEVRYATLPADYVPSFPEAERLSDSDIRTLRAVIVKLRLEKRSRSTQNLARRAKAAVERRLQLESVRMPAEAFLRLIVDDYTAAHDRYDI
ncbi:MAG: RDD family protein [Rubricoccaceae bacterium]|nr:RDD family protein [Rubricoccaceae bacterium]